MLIIETISLFIRPQDTYLDEKRSMGETRTAVNESLRSTAEQISVRIKTTIFEGDQENFATSSSGRVKIDFGA